VECVGGLDRDYLPAPGPPSTNITVTFSFSNMGFLASPPAVEAALSSCLLTPGMWRASAVFSTMLGAIAVAVLIRRVNRPDERVVV
jgi:hypothetical protein